MLGKLETIGSGRRQEQEARVLGIANKGKRLRAGAPAFPSLMRGGERGGVNTLLNIIHHIVMPSISRVQNLPRAQKAVNPPISGLTSFFEVCGPAWKRMTLQGPPETSLYPLSACFRPQIISMCIYRLVAWKLNFQDQDRHLMICLDGPLVAVPNDMLCKERQKWQSS